MLHIFHVEPGTMITLDMDMAIESVGAVKQHIAKLCAIPVDKQVLLVSGGASLDNDNLVCSYSAGTDTSPIFLFSVCAIESGTLPSASIDFGSDADLSARVAAMRALPVAQATVVQRTQLAMEAYEAARDISRTCKQLTDEQHLQLQGWGAVVANLEDLHTAFKRKVEAYRKIFDDYLEERLQHLDFLNHFHHDLLILSKIPMLTALLEAELAMNKEQQGTEVTGDINGSANSKLEDTVDTNCKPLTVSDWIASSDSKSAVEELFEHCKQGLEQINDRVIDALYREINSILDASNDINLKEVPGLRERLLGLEQLNGDAKKLVQDQADLAQSFQRNQQNPNLGDVSVLPDLCASHKEQLIVLLDNDKRLRDIRRRCVKAKNELSGAIYQRLKCVQHVQNSITVSNNKQVMYLENLKRIRQHLLIIQQIHLAPSTYLTAVAEVVRRRSFSQAFLLWASELACHLLTIHNDELARRRDFQTLFNGHFLNSLFPGMEDAPPDYATQAPSVFDDALPAVTTEDVEYLRRELARLDTNEIPHLDQLLEALEGVGGKGDEFNTTLANLLLVRSKLSTDLIGETGLDDKTGGETIGNADSEAQGGNEKDDQRTESTSKLVHSSTLPQPIVPHLKDWDKGCESETDTEEFEKLCQSPIEQPHQMPEDAAIARSTEISVIISRSATQDAATLTEVGSPTLSNTSPSRHRHCQTSQTSPVTISPQLININAPKKPPRSFHRDNSYQKDISPEITPRDVEVFVQEDGLQNASVNLVLKSDSFQSDFCTVPKKSASGKDLLSSNTIVKSKCTHPDSSSTSHCFGKDVPNLLLRTMSVSSSSATNTDSFTNIKNPSLESIDELCSLRNFDSTNSCYNSHHQSHTAQSSSLTGTSATNPLFRSKSLSPRTPQSPTVLPSAGQQPFGGVGVEQQCSGGPPVEFVNEEFYLDESRPSSACLSCENNGGGSGTSAGVAGGGNTSGFGFGSGSTRAEYYVNQLATAHDVVALLQDNLHSSRLAYTTQQSILSKLFLLSTQGLLQLRSELTNIKSVYLTSKNTIEQQVESLSSSWENLTVERDCKERDIIQKMSAAHELTLGSFRGQVQELTKKDNEMKMEWEKTVRQLQELKAENQHLQQSNDSLKIYKELTQNHEEHTKETVDRLNHEHKAEMENLRVRFRLMSAEIETTDESVTKLRKQLEEEKENAIVEAVLLESQIWKDRIDRLNGEHQLKMDEAVVEVQRQKDEKIKRLLEREKNLQLECIKYRTSLQQLAESETEARNVELQDRVNMLKIELELERNMRMVKDAREDDLTGSVALYEGKIDVATSPIRLTHHPSTLPSTSGGTSKCLTRSQTALVRVGHLAIDSCTVGDHVLVLWDTDHESYIILQRSSVQHFLHSDCLVELGLATDTSGGGGRRARAEEKREGRDGAKKLQYFVGEVVDKEYCNALKSENRYKVPKDTKFYRVKVKYSESSSKSPKEPRQSVMSQSQSASASTTASHTTPQTQITQSAHVMCQSLPTSLTDSAVTSTLTSEENQLAQASSALDTTDGNTVGATADGAGSSFDDLSSSEPTNR